MNRSRTLLVRASDEGDRVEAALEEAGNQVTAVDRATAALARLSSGEFDCLVSEYSLPGDDGLTLCEAVREVDGDVPFVLFGRDDEALANDAFDAGVDAFVAKNGAGSVTKLVEETEATASSTGRPEPIDVSEHEPEPEEIVRAVDDAPIGISLSDPSLPDNPLVYINDAWEEITGYDREEVLGRNPRMLQGPETDPETVERLAQSVRNETPCTVEVRNYRRDGTPWWNELTVAPVEDEDGEVGLYVGFQNDVTERKHAERLADERATKLREEKQTLRRVLGRVNGLLNELTRILVEEHERQIIQQRLCDEIAAADAYAAAWIGSTSPTGNSLELAASAGLPDDVETTVDVDRLPAVVHEAIESGEIARCSVGACAADRLDAASVGARRCAVVPLRYGRKRFGMLGVYGKTPAALDSYDQQLFASIGKLIASRLNAIETSHVLTADRVTEIEVAIRDDSFPLSAIADALGAPVEYVGMTNEPDEDCCELFLTTDGSETDADLTNLPFVEAARSIADTETASTLAVTVETATPFDDLAEHSASVDAVDATPERAVLSLELPIEHDVRSVLDLLDSLYEQVDLRSRREHDRRERTTHEFASQIDRRLTARQRDALEAAHMNGYFEWPRPTDGAAVAETIGITRQTFHQHLRAAERKLVEVYVDSCSGSDRA